ncbi:U32 family peptidase [Candidatus Woesearchaeota archaeon]|nr:U32 family peptidase [Candidatus Woesearchaeota archaeon]
METKKNIDIMAPAGSYESLMAALHAGATSVYFGIEQLNMRARATNNFHFEDLPKIAALCKKQHVKTYLTVNTILYDHDIVLMKKICDAAKVAGIDAIIASDFAVLQYAQQIGQPVHISTQMNISNIEAVRFFAQHADVLVLARELTLLQIKEISEQIQEQKIKGPSGALVQIEVFVHGALCVAISGKCYMSLATYNASANRGACLQNCRRSYKLTDDETGEELVVDNKYIMSPKDLCTIGFIDKLIEAGVSIMKIEGRGKAPEYVATVTAAYKEAVDSYFAGTYTPEKIEAWTKKLEEVYNRGFWHGGYYLGKKLGEWSGTYGSCATKEKKYLGTAKNYYPKAEIAHFMLEAGELKTGDEVIITGQTTGVLQTIINELYVQDKRAIIGKKGEEITFSVPQKIRKNDKLFVVIDKTAGKNA